MERYLPVAAALLALPHLLSIAAARHEPPAAVAAPRGGFARFAQQPYLQP